MPMPERLTLFFDISGRVTEETAADSYFTVGAILMPTLKENEIRKTLSREIPKWKNASPQSLTIIQTILLDRDVQSVVLRIEKSQPAWDRFWNAGRAEHRKLTAFTNAKNGFARPGTVIKYAAFGKCAAIGLAEKIKRDGIPRLVNQFGIGVLQLRIILDTDIQGNDNQDTFRHMWNAWATSTNLPKSLCVAPKLELVDFRTEQDDPALLLPDYLAGWAYFCASEGKCTISSDRNQVSINAFSENLRASANVVEITWPFDEEFPDLTTV